ncbi:MAG TPA: hypothetical protein VFH68_13940 [Polyangia bacterium]|jgi:hypothetical protein|nr:hypothetical protein [Polyangia bacterium]
MHRRLWVTWSSAIGLLVAAAGAAGCGTGGDGTTPVVTGGGGSGGAAPPGPVQTTSGPYEPLAVGASWTYHVNDSGMTYDKVSTVEATEDAGGMYAGVTVFRVHDHFTAEDQNTWYQVDGSMVKRLHENVLDAAGNLKSEDWFAPFRLRVDESADHMVAGAAWVMSYMDTESKPPKAPTMTSKNDAWRVDAVDEPVSVPFGTFLSLHVTRTDPVDGSTKSFWFVRGVGKVKEQTSGGHKEELTAHTAP